MSGPYIPLDERTPTGQQPQNVRATQPQPLADPFAPLRFVLRVLGAGVLVALLIIGLVTLVNVLRHAGKASDTDEVCQCAADAGSAACDCIADSEATLLATISTSTTTIATAITTATTTLSTAISTSTTTITTAITTATTTITAAITSAATSIVNSVTDLLAVYFGVGCIRITSIPYAVPYSHRCYRLAGNFTISTASSTAITLDSKRHVDIYFDRYELTFAVDARGVRIANGTAVRLHGPACNSLTQRVASIARCVQVDTNSAAVEVHEMYARHMRHGLLSFESDVRVYNPYVDTVMPGNGTTAGAHFGMYANDATNMVIEGGFISVRYATQATLMDPPGIAVYSSRDVNMNSGTNTLSMRDVYASATICYDFHRGQSLIAQRLRCVVDPLSLLGSGGQIVGSAGSYDSVLVEDVSINTEGNNLANDGLLLWNAKSAIVRNVAVYGAVQPLVGFYRGALLTVGIQMFPGGETFQWNVTAVLLKDITLKSSNNETVALHFNSGWAGDRFSAVVDGVSIDGGLVGVLMANNTQNVEIRNAHVSRAVYGYAALNYSSGNVIKDSGAYRCCQGFYADDTTDAIGVYRSEAVKCSADYDDQGTGNSMVVGTAARDNAALGTTGYACALPDPMFDPNAVSARKRSLDEERLATAQHFIDQGLAPTDATAQEVVALIETRLAERLDPSIDLEDANV